jgi:hypothetical protein
MGFQMLKLLNFMFFLNLIKKFRKPYSYTCMKDLSQFGEHIKFEIRLYEACLIKALLINFQMIAPEGAFLFHLNLHTYTHTLTVYEPFANARRNYEVI